MLLIAIILSLQPAAGSTGPYAMQAGSLQNLVQGSMLGTLQGSTGSLQPSMQSSIPANLPSSVLQGFNAQGLGFASLGQQPIQQSGAQPNVNLGTQSTLNKSAMPFKPAAARSTSNGSMNAASLVCLLGDPGGEGDGGLSILDKYMYVKVED